MVMYHVHVPRPDPMTTDATMARHKTYGANGVPAFAIDGRKTIGGDRATRLPMCSSSSRKTWKRSRDAGGS